MSRLVWDEVGKKTYKTGVDRGVLYLLSEGAYPKGEAWSGLTKVSEKPSGAEATAKYADNIKYLNLVSAEDYGATIEAYTYPDDFAVCDGSADIVPGVTATQQSRKTFGLCYRTLIGNDVDGTDFGYELHLVYGALAAPSEKENDTVNDSPEAVTMSWEITTTPVSVTGFKPTAHLIVNSTKVDAAKLKAFEDIIYGKDGTVEAATVARLPLPDEVATLLKTA